ncbi:MAG: acyltransferase [Woeseia sp.]
MSDAVNVQSKHVLRISAQTRLPEATPGLQLRLKEGQQETLRQARLASNRAGTDQTLWRRAAVFGLESPACVIAKRIRRAALKKFLRNFRGVAAFSVVTLNTIFWFVPIMLLALIKLVLPFAAARRALTRLLMGCAENWISGNAAIFGFMNNIQWHTRGLEGLSPDEWYLVIVNHQSWVDIVILQTLMNRRIPLLKFFIKKQLVWFPFLGLAFWALDMPFMQRHSKSYLAKHPEKKGSDLEATRRACRKFRYTPTSVINFIEGTRFSEAKRVRKNSPYQHLLQPRAGGLALALSSMGSAFTSILDLTIVYPRGVPMFWDMMCGELEQVVVEVRQREISDWMLSGDYVNDRDHRRVFHQWLGDVWTEKDANIAALTKEFS